MAYTYMTMMEYFFEEPEVRVEKEEKVAKVVYNGIVMWGLFSYIV